jgi:hypothetical protein
MNMVSDPDSGAVLEVPPLAGVRQALASLSDPLVDLLVAIHLDRVSEVELGPLRAKAHLSPIVQLSFGSQASDGSWGEAADPRGRILPTLWMAKALAELGLDRHPGWTQAVEFLATRAHTDDGVMSIDGHRRGVLSCYVGIAAMTYLLGNRVDLAEPQIRWIQAYQDVRRNGRQLRPTPVEVWHRDLATRFGGCLANTTCAVGLVKTGHALAAWNRLEPDDHITELIRSIRQSFLERCLFRTGGGTILPLGVTPGHASDWLEPTFPLDWRTDLIEVLEFVTSTGPPDEGLQPALDQLAQRQLPDRTWPLRRSFRPKHLPALERRSTRQGSPYVTIRVVRALRPLAPMSFG